MNLWLCSPEGLLGSEERTKLKVAGSSPAEVHVFFFFLSYIKCCIFRLTRLGFSKLKWLRVCSESVVTQIDQCNMPAKEFNNMHRTINVPLGTMPITCFWAHSDNPGNKVAKS